jgi:hypothetical protein
MQNLGIRIRCLIPSTGTALGGLAIGTMIEQPSPQATVVFAVGARLAVLGLLRRCGEEGVTVADPTRVVPLKPSLETPHEAPYGH